MIDFEKIFPNKTGNEILDILRRVSVRQQSNGVPSEKIAKEIIEFMINDIKFQDTVKVKECHDNINDNIKKLYMYGKWLDLFDVSIKALKRSIDTKKKVKEDFDIGLDLKNQIIQSGLSELKGVFNKDWLKDNYPSLYDKIEKDK